MSVIRKVPYIETVLGRLSDTNLTNLKNAINGTGSNVSCGFANLPSKGITPVFFKLDEQNYKSGILVYTDYTGGTQCVLIAYHRFQDLLIFELDATNATYTKISEYCDINELRRAIASASGGSVNPTQLVAKMEGNTGISVDLNETDDKVAVSIDMTGASSGKVLKANSDATDTEWKDVATSQTITIAVSDWNSGTTCNKSVTGVTATNVVLCDSSDSNVQCTAQAEGTLTFTATSTPTAAVTVKVVIL